VAKSTTVPPAVEAASAPTPSVAEQIDQNWNFDDAASSEARFRALAAARRDIGDIDGSREVLTQAARAQGLQGKMSDAMSTLDAVQEASKGGPAVVMVRVALERGRILNSARQPDKARPYFERALETARAGSLDALAVDAAHMIAITFLATPDEAIAWNERALKLARDSSDPRARRWLGSLLNNQGWSYFEKKRFDQALVAFEEALVVRREGTDVQARRIADWAVARALRALGKTTDALAIQERLRSEYEEAGRKSGFVFEELGECYLALGDAGRATPWFAAAYVELAKDAGFAAEEPERLARVARLGAVQSGAAR
jgi:tetratricopeptide (TPR) repeat protein